MLAIKRGGRLNKIYKLYLDLLLKNYPTKVRKKAGKAALAV
jgi:hypothetical protein